MNLHEQHYKELRNQWHSKSIWLHLDSVRNLLEELFSDIDKLKFNWALDLDPSPAYSSTVCIESSPPTYMPSLCLQLDMVWTKAGECGKLFQRVENIILTSGPISGACLGYIMPTLGFPSILGGSVHADLQKTSLRIYQPNALKNRGVHKTHTPRGMSVAVTTHLIQIVPHQGHHDHMIILYTMHRTWQWNKLQESRICS